MKCVDLFAGCGGMSLGFEQAGYEVVAAYDFWQPAIDVYKANFDHPITNFDLSDEAAAIQEIGRHDFDLIMGGPPCQDFSSAGKRDEAGGRADLTYSFTEIVCALKPTIFVMENVERIKRSRIFHNCIDQFASAGYGLTSVILDASYCGVPQARTRVFLIGHMGGAHNALTQIFSPKLAEERMTVRDYLGDFLELDYYYRHPRNYNRRGVFSIDEPSPTIRGVNRPIPAGYKINTCDPEGVSLKDIRPLTTKERSLIQTFPQSFKLEGSKTNLEQMIGNAVPVNLARFVAESISAYISGEVPAKSEHQPRLIDTPAEFEFPERSLRPAS